MVGLVAGLALKVIVLAGGGDPKANYNSHLVHVQGVVDALDAAGVPRADIALFWADGQSDAPDRAVVHEDDSVPGDWVIDGTPLGTLTASAPALVNTTVADLRGLRPMPARRKHLQAWLRQVGPTLGAGDTLAMIVTDHGEADPAGGRDTRIVLWDERWSKAQLVEDLKVVSEDARVLLWMSQCYSGGFADVALQRRNTCGAFSANADQVAYGCFPELAGRQDIGHFVRVLEGVRAFGAIAPASDQAMLTDDTPDTPHLSRDLFLSDALGEAADRRGVTFDAVIDEGLVRAPAAAPERVLARQIAQTYGLGALETSAQVSERLTELDDLLHAADTYSDLWQPTLDQARAWATRDLKVDVQRNVSTAARRTLRAAFVKQVSERVVAEPTFERALLTVHGRFDDVGQATAALEVQSAATRRVGDLLARAAAPFALDVRARAQLEALKACEDAPLIARASTSAPPRIVAYPAVGESAAQVVGARPGFYGVRYDEVQKPGKAPPADAPADLPRGAVRVDAVTANSPAAAAGLRQGDLVVAVDDQPLDRPGRYRETAFLSTPGQVRQLDLLRGRERLRVALTAGEYPLAPRPVVDGERLPALPLTPLEAPLPTIGQGDPVVLLYWATWCGPCKRSLPRLQDWAQKQGVQVIAITDESADTVRTFLGRFGRFPFPVALDRGDARALLGVEGIPRFVWVDGAGVIVRSGAGFDGQRLPIE